MVIKNDWQYQVALTRIKELINLDNKSDLEYESLNTLVKCVEEYELTNYNLNKNYNEKNKRIK